MSPYYDLCANIRIVITVCMVCLLSHVTSANAQEIVQGGEIFILEEPSSQTHTVISVSKPKSKRESKVVLKIQHLEGKDEISLDENVQDIQMGDVDNDGKNEIVIMTNANLSILEKKNSRYVIEHQKTTPLFGPNRKGNPSILSPSLSWLYYTPVFVPQEDELGGRIAIGDLNNDKKNEIVVIRPLIYNPDPTGPFKTYYSTVDILSWRDGYFEVIDNISGIFASGEEGIYILDLDGDDHSELVVGVSGDGFVVYGFVNDPENYPKHNGSSSSITGHYQVKGWIYLGINKSQDMGQRTAITTIDNKIVLMRCALWVSSGSGEEVGRIRFFYMDPNILRKLRNGLQRNRNEGKVPWLYAKDFEEIRSPIQLPVEKFEHRFSFVKLKRLSIRKEGHKIQLIVNIKDQAHIYEIQ